MLTTMHSLLVSSLLLMPSDFSGFSRLPCTFWMGCRPTRELLIEPLRPSHYSVELRCHLFCNPMSQAPAWKSSQPGADSLPGSGRINAAQRQGTGHPAAGLCGRTRCGASDGKFSRDRGEVEASISINDEALCHCRLWTELLPHPHGAGQGLRDRTSRSRVPGHRTRTTSQQLA